VRLLELPRGGTPRDWGRQHGEAFRGEIQSLAAIRIYLTQQIGRFADAASVRAAARAHLPVLEAFDADLYSELLGIAEGADCPAEDVVVLNHYTDLRDLDPAPYETADAGGGCSIIYADTPEGIIMAQTWDMHATAIPYTMMLRVPGPVDAWLLTLTGCLGMAGMNRAGVAVAINNLRSTDARVGVVWSALVRGMLAEQSAAAARKRLTDAPVGSGHHYLIADADEVVGIETSGQRRQVVYDGEPSHYVHTNHCVDPTIAEASSVPATSTTFERYDWLTASLAERPLAGLADAWQRLGSQENYPRSVCTNVSTPQNPHGTATCAAIAMNLTGRRTVWAAGGMIHNVAPEPFELDV